MKKLIGLVILLGILAPSVKGYAEPSIHANQEDNRIVMDSEKVVTPKSNRYYHKTKCRYIII